MMSSATASPERRAGAGFVLIAPPLLDRRPYGPRNSFSLIEVIVAMAVVTFSIVLIVGMLALGLSNNHDSSDRIQAANIASALINTRRASPTNVFTSGFILPPVYQLPSGGKANLVNVTTGHTYVYADGTTAPISQANSQEIYGAYYAYTTNMALPNVANVDLILWWPASAPVMPTNHPGNYYEVLTQIPVPIP